MASTIEIRRQLIKGDASWLETVFRNYKSYCCATIISKGYANETNVEDIFNEALIILHKNMIAGKITDLKVIKSYLTSICLNLARNKHHYKSSIEKKAEEVRLLYYPDVINEGEDEWKSNLLAICHKAIKKLTAQCQQIIQLYYLEKLRMKEIAELLKLSSSDVAKTLKSRCYKKLLQEVALLK